MTISAESRKSGPYIGNGSLTEFPFDFKLLTESDIRVVVKNTELVESDLVFDDDFSCLLNADQDVESGGVITLADPLPAGHLLVITSAAQYLQPVSLQNLGGFFPAVINDALDRLTIQMQQVVEQLSRMLTTHITDDDEISTSIPPAELRAGRYLAFDDNGAPAVGLLVAEIDSLLTENLSKVMIVAEDLSGDDTIGTVASDLTGSNTVGTVAEDLSTGNTIGIVAADLDGDNTIGSVAEIADDVSVIAENIENVNGFFKIYLGAYAVEPDARNDETELQDGDLYADTVRNSLMVYLNDEWVSTIDVLVLDGTLFKNYYETTGETTGVVDRETEGSWQVLTLTASEELDVSALTAGQSVTITVVGGDEYALTYAGVDRWSGAGQPTELLATHDLTFAHNGVEIIGFDLGGTDAV